MHSNRFYLACLRDNVGTNVSFHKRNGSGYTTNLHEAEELTLREAQKRWDNGREFDLPLCANKVDSYAVHHVDMQYIPFETTLEENCIEYIAFIKRKWNGNDVYWLTDDLGSSSTDVDKARTFSSPQVSEEDNLVWLPKSLVDRVKRPTFDVRHLDRRKMIQSAGLLTPDHVKRERRKKQGSGKTRWNCPTCGRISWQYNPYDFEGCLNFDCRY